MKKGMHWVPLDEASWFHPKCLAAGELAWGRFCRLLAASSAQRSDGFIPHSLSAQMGPAGPTRKLVEVGLLDPVEGGYLIHGFLEYNRSAEQRGDLSEKRRSSGAMGGSKTFSKSKANAQALAQASPEANAKQNFLHDVSKPLAGEYARDLSVSDLNGDERRGRGEKPPLTDSEVPDPQPTREFLDCADHPALPTQAANSPPSVAREPLPPSEKAVSGSMWRAAFEAGAHAATGRTHSAGPRFATDTLEDIVNTHAPTRDAASACAWIRAETEAYVRAWDGKTLGKGVSPDGLRNWLNDNRRPPPTFGKPARIVQAAPEDWEDDDYSDLTSKGLVAK